MIIIITINITIMTVSTTSRFDQEAIYTNHSLGICHFNNFSAQF